MALSNSRSTCSQGEGSRKNFRSDAYFHENQRKGKLENDKHKTSLSWDSSIYCGSARRKSGGGMGNHYCLPHQADILQCEVKWPLESITTNKASASDAIPVELVQILRDDAVKVLHSICQQIWKTQQWPQDWKMSVFIPIPKKGNAKKCSNYHTTAFISTLVK